MLINLSEHCVYNYTYIFDFKHEAQVSHHILLGKRSIYYKRIMFDNEREAQKYAFVAQNARSGSAI